MKRNFTSLLLFLNFVCLFDISIIAQKIAAGGRHSLSICADSTVQAWGYNGFGQLGNGSIIEQTSGTKVVGLSSIVKVGAGLFHSLFLKSDGTVWACGRNVSGALGDGSNSDKHIPVKVLGLSGIKQIAGGGEHSLFLQKDGYVYAVGKNSSRQLGDGTNLDKSFPTIIPSLSNIVQVAAGADFSLFLSRDGSVWACGDNGFGQYGNGNNISSYLPIKIEGLSNIVQISAGEWHSLFLGIDGTVYSAGRNNYGQLGIGSLVDNNLAWPINGLSDIVQIEAGGIHSVFVRKDGTAYACGLNSGGNNDGQLGDGTSNDRSSPIQVKKSWGNQKIIHAEATREHSLFLTDQGEIWACGRNNYGQLGYGTISITNSYSPVRSSKVCMPLILTSNIETEVIQSVYPNPFSLTSTLHFARDMNEATLLIYDSYGRQFVKLEKLNGNSVTIFRDNLPSGMYSIVLLEKGKTKDVTKVVIYDE